MVRISSLGRKKCFIFLMAFIATVFVTICMSYSWLLIKVYSSIRGNIRREVIAEVDNFKPDFYVNDQAMQSTGKKSPPCSVVPNRWTHMYNPSKFGGKSKFPLISPHIEPNISCEDRQLYIVVLVNSAANTVKHRSLRKVIRQTWGNSSYINSTKRWRLFFSLGLSTNSDVNLYNRQEATENNDVIIGKFNDTYRNIPYKTFMSHWWAFNAFSCQYVLKTDDDVYVRVPKLSEWLSNLGSPRRFYGGFISKYPIVFRNPKSPWYISYEQFNETWWPPFCHGAFHVISLDLLPAYFYYTQVYKPFHTDDAYLGVLARDFGVKVTGIPGMSSSKIPKTDCEFVSAVGLGDRINPPQMISIHEKYKNLTFSTNITCP